ncbi:poly(beta-D-mannuronate) lyase [Halomonas daqingensis]|uniref:Poly(Beta-D-mannuronate) lyase n=1 Tax=Billgrantia desiderata TaxID=52021 RepID=A0AAW4YTR0_9GAMM|nr:poly(beta-D-mannuronate) lyase [Halomonas desiderata]MCE8051525.1 poly(beta-D-mannuronate) lyase [Halomonas desiderata]OUE37872.1 poly(beta-D-mannuronate) lyase [Halomonas desiderata SP1]
MPLAAVKGLIRHPLLSLLPAALLAMGGSAVMADTLSREERMALDLSDYQVNDTDASYFDVEARMALLRETQNPVLLQVKEEAGLGLSCRQKLNFEPITTRGGIPGFYPNPDEWELATEPLFAFEDSVSDLAGAFVATGDTFYADCLVQYLHGWAEAKALTTFRYDSLEPQAWFASESMLFAAAMAYSIVRPYVEGFEEEKAEVERWLHGLALQHSAIPGEPEESCCNNHFYRRALYASMVGVLVEDDDLFRFGVSAIYSALHDMTESGALPLEVGRGRRATHYQNYALNYLITNMQVIHRQGYDIFDLEYQGSTIHEAVDFLFVILDDPAALGDYAPLEQFMGFLRDPQYFTWMDIYLSHYEHEPMADFVTRVRPTYNRSAGGFVTLYFMDPDAQEHLYMDEEQRSTEAFRGLGN